jgi:hypothetical protein
MVSDRSNGINWRKGVTAKLGLFIALAISASAIGWGWNYGLTQELTYEQEARQAHANYTRNGCNEIAKPKPQVASVKKAESEPCAPNEKAQQENDNRRDYADLVAQRSSALWAKIMGIAALIGMGLSLVGVALVWTTFRETRKANRIAEKSQRAWVTMNVVGAKLHNTIDYASITFSIDVHNSGNSAATNIMAGYAFSRMGEDTVDFIDKVRLWDGSFQEIERVIEMSDCPPGISVRESIPTMVDYPLGDQGKPKRMSVAIAIKIKYDFVGGGKGRTVQTFWVGHKVQTGGGSGDFIPGRDDGGEVEIIGTSYRQIS